LILDYSYKKFYCYCNYYQI